MAKTLGKLRQQTAKLRELEAPSDVSKGTKVFVKKHVYVVHPDANENDDDVFKATNVKRAKRAPDHGYEPGQDADIYESYVVSPTVGPYGSFNVTNAKNNRPAGAVVFDKKRNPVYNHPNGSQHPLVGGHRMWNDQISKIHFGEEASVNEGAYKKTLTGRKERARLTKAARVADIEDKIDGLENHDHRQSRKDLGKALRDKYAKHLTQSFEYDGEETDLDERFGLSTIMAIRTAAKIARKKRADKQRPIKKNGKLIPQDTTGYWKGTLELTPDMQDPEQKAAMAKHPLNGKIDRMVRDRKFQKNSYDPGEDFEHIAALSESDQSLLVDIYNSLTEDNQDRFLEIAETPEGVDKLLDFAITNSKGIK